MDDKIEAWRQEAERLCVNLVSRRFAMADTDLPDDEFMAAPQRYQETLAEFRAHLRTTPEGHRLVEEREVEALRKDAERFRSLRWRYQEDRDMGPGASWYVYVHTDNTKIRSNCLAVIDAALKEQSKFQDVKEK